MQLFNPSILGILPTSGKGECDAGDWPGLWAWKPNVTSLIHNPKCWFFCFFVVLGVKGLNNPRVLAFSISHLHSLPLVVLETGFCCMSRLPLNLIFILRPPASTSQVHSFPVCHVNPWFFFLVSFQIWFLFSLCLVRESVCNTYVIHTHMYAGTQRGQKSRLVTWSWSYKYLGATNIWVLKTKSQPAIRIACTLNSWAIFPKPWYFFMNPSLLTKGWKLIKCIHVLHRWNKKVPKTLESKANARLDHL